MTTYYVAANGSDSNNGTSTGTPYQTIGKAKTSAIAGDTILLNQGDTFRITSGVSFSVNNLTLGTYGSGARPQVLGSKDVSGTYSVSSGAKYVKSQSGLSTANNTAAWIDGNTRLTLAASVVAMTAGTFFPDTTNSLFYVWTPDGSDPSGRPLEVKAIGNTTVGITMTATGATMTGWAIRYFGRCVQWGTTGADIGTVSDCDLGPAGHQTASSGVWCIVFAGPGGRITGCYVHDSWNGFAHSTGGLGYGIEVTTGTTTTQIDHNIVINCYSGISGINSCQSPLIHHNLVDSSFLNGIDFEGGTSSDQPQVINNTVRHKCSHGNTAGHAIDSQSPSPAGPQWRNNIAYSDYTDTATDIELYVTLTGTTPISDIDYNCGYLAPGTTCVYGELDVTQYSTFSAWQTALAAASITGAEAHGFSSNPLFQDVSTGKYTLGAGSPCLTGGVIVPTYNPTTCMGAYIPPVVSGSAPVGSVLTCAPDTYPGSYSVAYQWTRAGSSIGGATSSTYTTVSADSGQPIGCTITLTQDVAPVGGGAMASSNTVIPTGGSGGGATNPRWHPPGTGSNNWDPGDWSDSW